jgi:hypothetical protein
VDDFKVGWRIERNGYRNRVYLGSYGISSLVRHFHQFPKHIL